MTMAKQLIVPSNVHINFRTFTPAPYQKAILDSPTRFTVVISGTKNGKTLTALSKIMAAFLTAKKGNFWWVAPTYSQAKIAFNRIVSGWVARNNTACEAMGFTAPFRVNLSDLSITYVWQGTTIQFKSAENFNGLYGEDVYGAVFDEYTRARPESRDALLSTLTATKGWCLFIGNATHPEHWGMELYNIAVSESIELGEKSMYTAHKITCYDAIKYGILDAETVEQQRRFLPSYIFARDYEARYETGNDNPFITEFSEAANVANVMQITGEHAEPLYLAIDFNVENATALICTTDKHERLHVLDEIYMRKAFIWELMAEVKRRYPNGEIRYIVPDPSGGQRNATHKSSEDTAIEQVRNALGLGRMAVLTGAYNPRYSKSAMSHKNSRDLCNITFRNKTVLIHPKCTHLLDDIKGGEWDDAKQQLVKGSGADANNMNALDCFRYIVQAAFYNPLRESYK